MVHTLSLCGRHRPGHLQRRLHLRQAVTGAAHSGAVWHAGAAQPLCAVWLLLLGALPLPGEPAGHALLWAAPLSWLCRRLGMLTSPGLFQACSPATRRCSPVSFAHWPFLLCPSHGPIWQDHLHLFMVTRSRNCLLTVQTLPNTTTGGCVRLLVLPQRCVPGAPGSPLPCALLRVSPAGRFPAGL